MFLRFAFLGWLLVWAAPPAHACGGGLVTVTTGGAVADAQRVLLSVRDGRTDVVTEVTVPGSQGDFGVLIPLPSRPTLDPRPVPTSDLDALDVATAPRIIRQESGGGGGGIGCFTAGAGGDSKGAPRAGGVDVSRAVEIGPVSAVILTADTGQAINDWLSANGFALDDGGRALVDAYTAPGHAFIALRRSSRDPAPGATSVGVHFTLEGDQRTLPLRFARLGAAPTVAFTVFLFAPRASGPAEPFVALTMAQLDRNLVRASYRDAVAAAVRARAGKAFVVEGVFGAFFPDQYTLEAGLSALVEEKAVLTRLTTVVRADQLTADAQLDGAQLGVPREIQVPAALGYGLGFGWLAFFARRRWVTRCSRRRGGPSFHGQADPTNAPTSLAGTASPGTTTPR